MINAIVTQGLPGPVFPFHGLRVTNIYTTESRRFDTFAALESVLRTGLG